ncbi:muscleblind-like protein 2a isoform X3 [Pomacea canaliculata]|uniref:muscleblind-like protein 2a isoform X3 n=1 Tax=Pomacea canaliculata TaxID=400727 RepID=UPI000D72D90E|nr:muscleblind-like protein 2a isoform X3 [Pomacea canaliculata]
MVEPSVFQYRVAPSPPEPVMAMVNPITPMLNPNAKDSRWLTLEVCREYQRNKCTRTENECKFAHPPAHVEVQNGRVIACFDSIKGKCQRKDPPCKYLHPPQHLREQLLQNGRNNLILKSLQLQALHHPVLPSIIPMAFEAGPKAVAYQAVLPGQVPYLTPHYLGTVPTSAVPQFSPYAVSSMPATMAVSGGTEGTMVTQQLPGVISTSIAATKTSARPDRLEVCREFQRGTCTRQASECRFAHPTENVTVDSSDNHVTVCMDFIKNKCTRDSCRYFHPPAHLQSQIKAAQQRANSAATAQAPALAAPQLGLQVPPYKRVAVANDGLGKSTFPMYQPTLSTAYHQATLMQQLQQQPFIPVTYSTEVMSSNYPNYLPADPLVVSSGPPAGVGVTRVVGGLAAPPTPVVGKAISSNAYSIEYFDKHKQLLDTLPLCRDFRAGLCDRPTCKFVHVSEDVELTEVGRVVVCRDSVRNACKRASCKYYHIPVPLPPST